MSTPTITVDPELARQALGDALDADAAAQPAAEAPPRRPRPADATDAAPWGFKADGTPRKGPPGPGRPRKDPDAGARTQDSSSSATSSPTSSGTVAVADPAGEDYTDKIGGALTFVWMGLSMVPWTQAHAAILNRQIPDMIPAWNQASQQNPTVRKYVLKLSEGGQWAWVIPVAVTTTPLVLGMFEATRNREVRTALKAENQGNFRAFLLDQAQAAGLTIPDEATSQPDSGSQADPPTAEPGQSGTTEPSSSESSPAPSAYLLEV